MEYLKEAEGECDGRLVSGKDFCLLAMEAFRCSIVSTSSICDTLTDREGFSVVPGESSSLSLELLVRTSALSVPSSSGEGKYTRYCTSDGFFTSV